MLMLENGSVHERDGVACDVLILPDAQGNLSDHQLRYQHKAYFRKHFVREVTPQLLKSLRGEFIAIHESGSPTHPCWLHYAISETIRLHATAYLKSDGVRSHFLSTHQFCGAGEILSRDLLVELILLNRKDFFGRAAYNPRQFTNTARTDLFSLPITRPSEKVYCDVIVPFNDRTYLRDALDGLLKQNNAHCVIHAIDDCCGEDIDDLICDYPMVRWYSNKRNIGQFMSVNNVASECKSEFIAINDADDISEPNRIWLAVTAMQLSGSDIYGSQASSFSADGAPCIDHFSAKPYEERFLHPLVHGSMVVRKSAFLRMNGYCDFGDVLENKCANDTEFMLRAYFAGFGFHVGQSKSIKIRAHSNSCSNILGHASIQRKSAARKTFLRMGAFKRHFDPALFGAGCDDPHNVTVRRHAASS